MGAESVGRCVGCTWVSRARAAGWAGSSPRVRKPSKAGGWLDLEQRTRCVPGPGRPATDITGVLAGGGTIYLLGREDPYRDHPPSPNPARRGHSGSVGHLAMVGCHIGDRAVPDRAGH